MSLNPGARLAKRGRGLFITFEGIDGCGKTTQLSLLKKHLQSKGVRLITTREPGGCRLSEKIRSLLLDPANPEMDRRTELLLYLASRSQHAAEIILPSLEKGATVLCDRFSDATLAYQAGGRALNPGRIHDMDRFATRGLRPDLTFLFDLPVREAVRRLKRSGKRADRLEKGGSAFMERVRRAYLELAKKEPRRVAVINAARPVADIRADVLAIFKRRTRHD
jgi:dTMP kinase